MIDRITVKVNNYIKECIEDIKEVIQFIIDVLMVIAITISLTYTLMVPNLFTLLISTFLAYWGYYRGSSLIVIIYVILMSVITFYNITT
jgi:hypothetical protein